MKISRRKWIASFGGLSLSAITGYAGLIEPKRLTIEKHEVKKKTKGNLSKINIVQISDLHLKSMDNFYREIIKKVIELKPDLILFTGDSIDSAEGLDHFNDFLDLFPKLIDKISILGNWEHWSKIEISYLIDLYKKHNCRLLINETINYLHGENEILPELNDTLT